MNSNQMFTNTGMIGQIQATWEGERAGVVYASPAGETHALDGTPLTHEPVARLDNVSGDLYRKFCARCHVARQNEALDGNGHPAGCAACHFPYGERAAYRGGDPTMKGKSPHSRTHAMSGLPPMEACLACHQRSGRHALSYQGLMDGNNGLVPTQGGGPGPMPASDERNFTHIAADVHFLAGMECIDCHTSREVMGEGYAAPDMRGQLEIRCEDCHGDGERSPSLRHGLARERPALARVAPVRLPHPPRRPGGAHRQGPAVLERLRARRARSSWPRSARASCCGARWSPARPSTPIAGHERMECAACHSRSVVQCYGCHTQYDKRGTGWDFIQAKETQGEWSETEDYRRLYPFPLALNDRGKISPVTPGCQTFVSVIEPDGTRSKSEDVALYKGKPQLRFAPFFGHNTGPRAVGCTECHGNPTFLGFGQHVIEKGQVRGTLLCEKNPKKPLDGFLAMERGRVVAHAAITRKGARPLAHDEVRRVFAVNLCLVCHDTGQGPDLPLEARLRCARRRSSSPPAGC